MLERASLSNFERFVSFCPHFKKSISVNPGGEGGVTFRSPKRYSDIYDNFYD